MTYITPHNTTFNATGLFIQSIRVVRKERFVAMKISLVFLILGCFDGIFGSWVYSQRPYFHWIKSKLILQSSSRMTFFLDLKLSDLKKDSPSTTPPPVVRAVTPRSGEISGDKFRRQQTGGQRASFSSFFRQGSLNTEARSRGN